MSNDLQPKEVIMSGADQKHRLHMLQAQVADLNYHVRCGARGSNDEDRENLAQNRAALHRRKMQLAQAMNAYYTGKPSIRYY